MLQMPSCLFMCSCFYKLDKDKWSINGYWVKTLFKNILIWISYHGKFLAFSLLLYVSLDMYVKPLCINKDNFDSRLVKMWERVIGRNIYDQHRMALIQHSKSFWEKTFFPLHLLRYWATDGSGSYGTSAALGHKSMQILAFSSMAP